MAGYNFPLRCCRCVGPAEDVVAITTSQNMGTYQVVQSVKAPICRACQRTLKKIPIVVGVLAALAVIAISAAWDEGDSLGLRIFMGTWMGALLGGLAGYAAEKLFAPARLSPGGRLEFHSEVYQKLFEGKLPPEAAPVMYSLLQSPKCGRCDQVYPSLYYFQVLKNPAGITALCNSCFQGLSESEKQAAGVPIQS